jgi:hypothetical protein
LSGSKDRIFGSIVKAENLSHKDDKTLRSTKNAPRLAAESTRYEIANFFVVLSVFVP